MSLEEQLLQVKQAVTEGRFRSEAAVSQGVVLPVLNALGWPVFDTEVVTPEFSVENKRIDFALCHPANNPAVFVEVKQIGQTEGADRQLFEYAFHSGIPMAILTNGREWSFYLPAERGHYDERRVYKLDLLEREIDQCCERLRRYIEYSRTCSGESIQAAREDYKDVTRGREIEAALPRAWSSLLQEQDSLLLDMLAEKVADICGYEPSPNDCRAFFQTLSNQERQTDVNPIDPQLQLKQHNRSLSSAGAGTIGSAPSRLQLQQHKGFQFSLQGQQYRESSARAVMAKVFELLAQTDPEFPDKFAARKHGRKRKYLARNKFELYPGRPDLVDQFSHEIFPGWWLGTNYSRRNIQQIIDLAKKVVRLEIGRTMDVRVDN